MASFQNVDSICCIPGHIGDTCVWPVYRPDRNQGIALLAPPMQIINFLPEAVILPKLVPFEESMRT